MAGTIRLLLVGVGGWWLASSGAAAWTLFALVGPPRWCVFGLLRLLFIRFHALGQFERLLGAIRRCTNLIYCYASP